MLVVGSNNNLFLSNDDFILTKMYYADKTTSLLSVYGLCSFGYINKENIITKRMSLKMKIFYENYFNLYKNKTLIDIIYIINNILNSILTYKLPTELKDVIIQHHIKIYRKLL